MESEEEALNPQSYVYEPLKDGNTQIRLLTLCPAKKLDSELCGRLSTHQLNSRCTRFEALSYTWGSEQSPENLQLEGGTLEIGLNLRDALRALRHQYLSRTVWIDAVCMNQADNYEKTSQIAIMGSIYAKAWRTVVWVGNDSHGGDGAIAIKFFSRAAKKLWYREKVSMLREACVTFKQAITGLLPRCLLVPRRPFSNIEAMMQPNFWKGRYKLEEAEYLGILRELGQENMEAAIIPFLRRAWFSRRWIIQEVCLARKAVMICGDYAIDWKRFDKVISSDRHNKIWQDHQLPAYELAFSRWRLQQDVRLRHYGTGSFDKVHDYSTMARELNLQDCARELFSSMQSLDHFQCQDSRDIIAALLGLWGSFSGRAIVDYSLSIEQNFTSFAKQMIAAGMFMDIVYASIQRPRLPEHKTGNLPYWVPDWRFPTLTAWLLPPTSWKPNFCFSASEDGTETLHLEGICLDEVATVYPSEGYRLQDSSMIYTGSGGFGVATNMNKAKVPVGLDQLNGQQGSQALHLVRPGDLIYALAVDELFMQGGTANDLITHGLFVLRASGLSNVTNTNTFQIISILSQYKPPDALSVRSTYRNNNFQSIAIA